MIYVLFFVLSFTLTYLIKNYAIKKSLVAHVNERSSHTTPTPHGGGIAIAVTWFVGLFYLYFSDSIDSHLFFALLVGVIISVVSYFDDLFELSAKVRLLTQATVALLGLWFLGGFGEFDLFFFTIDNQFLTNIFAFFLIIWFINLYNFLDGIDGYAGSEAVFLGVEQEGSNKRGQVLGIAIFKYCFTIILKSEKDNKCKLYITPIQMN